MMTDHPLYRALLAALAVGNALFVTACIVHAIRKSVKGDRDNE